jgi:hypothetical protein
MKGVVLKVQGTENYLRFAHSDHPEVDEVPIEQATMFWPKEMEPGFESELVGMAQNAHGGNIEIVKVKVKVKVRD